MTLSSALYAEPIAVSEKPSTSVADEFPHTRTKTFFLSDLKSSEKVLITAILDGDTLLARFSDGKLYQIRLLGINTPEVTTISYSEQCFGAEATAAVSMALKGGRYVYLKPDLTNRDEDDFGRKLRYVYVFIGNSANQYLDLSEYLVANGYATVFREYPSVNKPLYLQREKAAQNSHIGLWREC